MTTSYDHTCIVIITKTQNYRSLKKKKKKSVTLTFIELDFSP